MKRTLIVATLVGIAALALRLCRIEFAGITVDEAFSWRVTQGTLSETLARVANDTHPPAHFLVLWAWQRLAGQSLLALRLPSAVFGACAAALAGLVVEEARRFHVRPRPSTGGTSFARPRRVHLLLVGLACGLTALHGMQLDASRTARMYALGCMLQMLTCWLLLRATREVDRPLRWWAAYGIAASIFLLTHYFALFSFVAQMGFAGIIAGRKTSAEQAVDRRPGWRGIVLGLGLAMTIVSPWLYSAFSQVSRVRQGFWIPEASFSELTTLCFQWATGLAVGTQREMAVCLVLIAMVAGVTMLNARRAEICLLMQAAAPWVAAILISTLGDRPLVQARYMVFSTLPWICLVVLIAERAPGQFRHAALVLLSLWIGLLGWSVAVRTTPNNSSALEQALRWLGHQWRPGDVLVVSDLRELNRARYYGAQQGFDQLDVRCSITTHLSPGQESQAASLHAHDVLWDASPSASVRRIWRTPHGRAAPPEWRYVTERGFTCPGQSSEDAQSSLTLSVRPD